MAKRNVIAVFDVGKTNKKLFLFDEQYQIVFEETGAFQETKDEDGFPCEDLDALSKWVKGKFVQISSDSDYNLLAVNFSAYGASWIHLDKMLQPITPLYNYLKPYPEKLKRTFYEQYGAENLIARQTASPVLGSLNSGMQLFRLKYERPEIFARLRYSLHLPQYLSFLVSSKPTSEITSIGCHTQLWDFEKHDYHPWVDAEGLRIKFPPIHKSDSTLNVSINGSPVIVGMGLHDSSSALIPYLKLFPEPFVLLSTGTWCISLNPFNFSMLTDDELQNDCLSYLNYLGQPVKASRLFAGHEHEEQVKKLSDYFHKDLDYYKRVAFKKSPQNGFQKFTNSSQLNGDSAMIKSSSFEKRDLSGYESYEEAYHQLIADIMEQQVFSTGLVLAQSPVKKIFVDGGFGKNEVYMNLLASVFPGIQVYAANIAQASSLGAALVLHFRLKQEIPGNLIDLKHYPVQNIAIN